MRGPGGLDAGEGDRAGEGGAANAREPTSLDDEAVSGRGVMAKEEPMTGDDDAGTRTLGDGESKDPSLRATEVQTAFEEKKV